jgi:hypothetical protein
MVLNRRAFLGSISILALALYPGARREPMRLSSDKNDPGYALWRKITDSGKRVRVYLDGVEQDAANATVADERNGYITRAVLDGDGELTLNETKTEVLRETVRGAVRIDIA